MLLSLSEAAQRLGGVSVRTIRRLIDRGELDWCPVGRLKRIPADSIEAYETRHRQSVHNSVGAEPVAWKGNKPCYSNVRGRRLSMPIIETRSAKELNDLLVRLTEKKQKR